MTQQKGQISVQTENIFPIIKQFLYSDQEIFLRELISNAVDATSKLKTLNSKGEVKQEVGDLTIDIIRDEQAGTLTIRDRGIGMTSEEVAKYLNQVAFSSAQEFLDKYKEDANIIGHFGLGFYSAFMVADQVEVVTRSYKEGSEGVKWTCNGDPEYTIEPVEKNERGTDIILHISNDAKEYLEQHRIAELLEKYCKFLPVAIRFGTKTESHWEGEGEDRKEVQTEVDNIVNNPNPAWKKQPSDLKEEDYKNFYEELYPFSKAPSFWIHLNIDYPFNLTGILYFPSLTNNIEVQKNKIHLYSNQVYVTDEVREIVPEFLTLLHGVIDSPDIPLNVSRSYLQSDANVRKISSYITRKVADRLNELFKKDRKIYEEKWPEIGAFVKYGMVSEEKFAEKATDFALLKDIDGGYYTLPEYKDKIKDTQTDKNDVTVIIYTNQPEAHHTFIDSAKLKGYSVLEMDQVLDNHYMQHLEYKQEKIRFVRVDSDTVDNLIPKDENQESVLSEKDQEKVKAIFDGLKKDMGATVQLKALSPEDMPVIITKPEFMRRYKEMQMLQGSKNDLFPDSYNVVVNTNHPLVAGSLLSDTEQKSELAQYLLDLALLNQGMLKGAELTNFVKSSLKFAKSN